MHVLVIRPATLTVSPAISTSATAEVNRRSINATGRVMVSNFVRWRKPTKAAPYQFHATG